MNGIQTKATQLTTSVASTLFGTTDISRFPTGFLNTSDQNQSSRQVLSELPNHKPFFSVVMTTGFSNFHYLEQALQSLEKQTFFDYEIVAYCRFPADAQYIHDFCTTNKISSHVREDKSCKSRSDRFNMACGYAKGRWIVILDADDILHPMALQTVKRCLERFPIMNYFCGSHHTFVGEGKLQKTVEAAPLAQTVNSLIHCFQQRHLWGFRNDSCRWPSNLFTATYPVEDYWFFACLAMNATPVLHIPHVLYGYRIHEYQWSQMYREDMEEMCVVIGRKLRYFKSKQSPMWFFGDNALAVRMSANMVSLAQEVRFDNDF